MKTDLLSSFDVRLCHQSKHCEAKIKEIIVAEGLPAVGRFCATDPDTLITRRFFFTFGKRDNLEQVDNGELFIKSLWHNLKQSTVRTWSFVTSDNFDEYISFIEKFGEKAFFSELRFAISFVNEYPNLFEETKKEE